MSQKNENISVQGTNDKSTVSKGSMVSLGYFKDDYINYFITKLCRRSPLINRGYYIRVKAIDCTLQRFVETFSGQKNQIISLGAGFDSSFFRLSVCNLLKETFFIEVDFLEVLQRKSNIIKNCPKLSQLVGIKDKGALIQSEVYCQIGVDLDQLDSLESSLSKLGVDFEIPTLILSECAITYMKYKCCDNLIRWAADTFGMPIFVTYEQVYPDDPFGIVMTDHFKSQGSPLKSIRHYPSVFDQIKRYKTQGWNATYLTDMNTFFYNAISKEEITRIQSLEPFDEFEEWHLKCNHYVIICAFKGNSEDVKRSILFPVYHSIKEFPIEKYTTLQWKRAEGSVEGTVMRWGHSSAKVTEILYAVIGGEYLKSQEVCLVDKTSNKSILVMPTDKKLGRRMFHTATSLSNHKVLIFGGRTSPLKPCEDTVLLDFLENASGWSYDCRALDSVGDVPQPRWRHSATSLTLADGRGCVLIFGGLAPNNQVLGDCFVLDTESWTWREFGQETCARPGARHSHGACAWGPVRLVISCGLDQDMQASSSIHVLDLDNSQWKEVQTLPKISPRYSHSTHVFHGQLLLLGGVSPHSFNVPGLDLIDLSTGCWRSYNIQTCSPYCGTVMLHKHHSMIISDQELLVIGGGGNCFSFGTHFNFSPLILDITNIGSI